MTRAGLTLMIVIAIGCGADAEGPPKPGAEDSTLEQATPTPDTQAPLPVAKPARPTTGGSDPAPGPSKKKKKEKPPTLEERRAALARRIRARQAAYDAKHPPKNGAEKDPRKKPDKPVFMGQSRKPPELIVTYHTFEQPTVGTLRLRVRLRTNFPTGGLMDAVLSYRGENLPAFRGRGMVRDGRGEILLGPVTGFVSSGTYRLTLAFEPSRQAASYETALRARFGKRMPTERVELRRDIMWRAAELKAGEVRRAMLHYEEVSGVGRTLFEAMQQTLVDIDEGKQFRRGKKFDHKGFFDWRRGWRNRLTRIRKKHRGFVGQYSVPPHPRLSGRIDVLADHLALLGWMRHDEVLKEHAPKKARRGRARDEEGFITPEDLERSVRQILHEIEMAVKGSITEADSVSRLVRGLEQLASGPTFPPGSDDAGALVKAYRSWAARLAETEAGEVLSPRWDPLVNTTVRLRRELRAAWGVETRNRLKSKKHRVPEDLARLPSITLESANTTLDRTRRLAKEINDARE